MLICNLRESMQIQHFPRGHFSRLPWPCIPITSLMAVIISWKLWLKIYCTQGMETKHWAQHTFIYILFDYLQSDSRSLMYISSQQPSMATHGEGKKLEIFLYPRSRESHLGKQANCLKSAPTCTANMNSKSIHHISWRWCMHCRKTCCAQVWKEFGKG